MPFYIAVSSVNASPVALFALDLAGLPDEHWRSRVPTYSAAATCLSFIPKVQVRHNMYHYCTYLT